MPMVQQQKSGNKTQDQNTQESIITELFDDSTTDLMQKGTGTHTAYITLQGSETTDLTLIQQGNTTQSYSLTQTCVTVGGCSVTVTQGN